MRNSPSNTFPDNWQIPQALQDVIVDKDDDDDDDVDRAVIIVGVHCGIVTTSADWANVATT